MSNIDIIEPFDDEDVSDVIVKLEKSFELKLPNYAFNKAETIGDILAIFQSYIQYPNDESCTKMQAFFRIRVAIANTLLIDPAEVTPEHHLKTLFPYQNRRKKIREFHRHLGIKTKILTAPDWLSRILLAGIFISLIGLFFYGYMALAILIALFFAQDLANKFGKQLDVHTVRQLTEKLVTDRYIAVRRKPRTVNRNEVWDTIQAAFSEGLRIDKKHITPELPLKWSENATPSQV